ncbi:hypothetical protein BKA64DRAFT_766290 [Cadophora sp. MPI-SDFR-AT-0126]|nr:hypothetical protein BKA64DRAFT_766290 [Leotiomycetes sp. MPI-SDFR-AT-0126]
MRASHQDPRQYKQPSASTITSLIPRQLDTLQPTSSKRKQDLEDGRASKRIHIELADRAESGFEKSNTRFPTRQTYEQFALRYYMLVPSSSWTAVARDMANKVLTALLEASKG